MAPERRTRRPRMHPLAAVIALALAGVPFAGAHAETFVVTSCADDGSAGTLRSVVAGARDGDTIDMTQLACSTITLQQGQVEACPALTINGPGQDRLTIDGRGASPVLYVLYPYYNPQCASGDPGPLTLRDVTLAHGSSRPEAFYQHAACLTSKYGSVVLDRVTITDCHGYFTNDFDGGAVTAIGLTMIDSTISDSSARQLDGNWPAKGGGANVGGATLIRSTIKGNSVMGAGGGLYVGGRLVMVDSSISGNSAVATETGQAASGGGVRVSSETTILRSVIADNRTDGDGGGLYKGGQGNGSAGGFTIQNSTIAGNRAGGTGGALVNQWPVTIANSTIAGNYSALGGAVSLKRDATYFGARWPDFESTIIAGNSTGPAPQHAADLGSADAITVFGASNLVGEADAALTLPPDTLRGDPQLLPLADHGGLTATMPPSPGSPAIDAGANALRLVADQRAGEFVRIHGAAADIGAYEVQPVPVADRRRPALPVIDRNATASSGGVPSVLPVTSCADDGSPGTLRAVAALAHDGDTIDMTQLACSTITLEHGPIDVSVLGPNPLASLTLAGPGQEALTISGNGTSAVFIGGGITSGNFTLSNLTLAHGAKYDTSACVSSFFSSLVLDGVTATDCHTRWAGGGAAGRGSVRGGGAVGAWDVQLVDSTISGSSLTAIDRNVAAGGGLWAYQATLVGSIISGNSVVAPVDYAFQRYRTAGGGVYSVRRMELTDSTISGNSAEATEPGAEANGGGVAAGGITAIRSTISGNSADGLGGGVGVSLDAFGRQPTEHDAVSFYDSTLTGNIARFGAAIGTAASVTLYNSTVAFNTSADGGALGFAYRTTWYPAYGLLAHGSIIASNASGPAPVHAADVAALPTVNVIVVGDHNLVGAADLAMQLPPDTLHTDPLLLPLAWNGGPTQTLALAPGSPAVDAGSNPLAFATDQRGDGYVRESGSAADIGAYEVQPGGNAIFANGFDP